MILNESTRDKMLTPYVELLQSKGINTNLGLLKTELLKLLADRAGIHNLSLRSNFYLAGAARYYFNGDLTVDGNVGMLTGQEDHFDEEICNRLNALIVILRNAYIDSVGTQFEQPEDFGTLKLPVLLKKYNSKINKELGIASPSQKQVEVDKLDRTPNIGKGYSFEIIYNYNLGTKFERATAPGAWCVTYGLNHFNTYTNGSNPKSHLIVFKMDGWENIDRKNGRDESMWVKDNYNRNKFPRPHDPYANSLIAFFQSNESWEPAEWYGAPLITSRWNHGTPSETGTLEADRAYTLEEFMQITGVSPKDLQRIYEIWEHDKSKKVVKGKSLSPEEKAKRLEFLRMLKYAQMRANGGEKFNNIIEGFEIIKEITKKVFGCKVGENYFLIDNGQIVFDSIIYNSPIISPFLVNVDNDINGPVFMANSIIIKSEENVYSIYNYRMHKIINVEGYTKFCAASIRTGEGEEPLVMLFRQRGNINILFSSKTGLPIKLPNGRYVFEYCKYGCPHYGVLNNDNYITKNDCLFIMCDSSSLESYIYLPNSDTFSTFDKRNFEDVLELKSIYMDYYFSIYRVSNIFEMVIEYIGYNDSVRKHRYILFDTYTGKQLSIFPDDKPFAKTRCIGQINNYIILDYDSKSLRKLGIPRVDNKPILIYNFKTKQFVKDSQTGKPMQISWGAIPIPYTKKSILYCKTNRSNDAHFIDLDTSKKYPLPIPNRMYTVWINLRLKNSEFFCCQYGHYPFEEKEIENTLKKSGYACKGDLAFFKYDDFFNGIITPPQEINVDKLYEIVKGPQHRGVNENKIKISQKDIIEMVKKVTTILLEIKKRGL